MELVEVDMMSKAKPPELIAVTSGKVPLFVDDDGFMHVVDRLKDVVIRGGENVYAAEVEAALFEHPDISDAAVVGVPHASLGEEVAAAVVLREGAQLSERELRDFAAGRLADFKLPRKVVFCAEIPKGATGKIQRYKLRG